MIKFTSHIIFLVFILSSCQIVNSHREFSEYDYPPFEDEKVSFYDMNFELELDEKFTNKDKLVDHSFNWVKKYFVSIPRYLERQRELFKRDEDVELIIEYDFEFDVVKAEGVCVYDKKKQFFCKVVIEFEGDIIIFKYFDFIEYERYSNKEAVITNRITLDKIHKKLWEITNKFFE
jgi:hypothetical protein